MKKEVITISAAVLSGALTRGATGYFLDASTNTTKMLVNGAGCVGFGLLSVKITGEDNKAAMLRGSAIGASIAHGLEFMKNIASTEKVTAKLAEGGAFNKFLSKTAGLNADFDGLNGYIDANGNYHEDGVAGYIDAAGNYHSGGLNGYVDEAGNWIEEGLQGYVDEAGNWIEEGLQGYVNEAGEYVEENVEEGLSAAVDEKGNIVL